MAADLLPWTISGYTGWAPPDTMDITFRKLAGQPALGIVFFWRLEITGRQPGALEDYLIPELYYDYLFIQRGQITAVDQARQQACQLPRQTLRGLCTRPFGLRYTTPLVLFGARLSLAFAEWYWEPRLKANTFLEQDWIDPRPASLAAFATQVAGYVHAHRARKCPQTLLNASLHESNWLGSYSPRQKRRLYQSVFGLSRQALERVRGLHTFLEQLCDFEARRPHILAHVNPDRFYDQPHLNRVFKKMTGLSPLEYFGTPSYLQDNLLAASYNAPAGEKAML